MSRILKWWRNRRLKAYNEALEQLEKEGEIEWCGYRYGEKTYRLTEKGFKHAEEIERRRP